MAKLTDERLAEIRDRNDTWLLGISTHHGNRDRTDLLEHIAAQEAELEDTRAAYQLTRHQLDAHRAGQGTYEGITR